MKLKVVAVVCVALAGCQTTTETASTRTVAAEEPTKIDPKFVDQIFAFTSVVTKAEVLAEECRSARMNNKALNASMSAFDLSMASWDYSYRQFDAVLESATLEKRIQDEILDWVQARDILFSDQSSFCDAAVYEVQAGTDVGRLLTLS